MEVCDHRERSRLNAKLDAALEDRTRLTPLSAPPAIDAINGHGRHQAENQAPELQRPQRQIACLEKQDANLRHALRIAKPNAAERIALEIDEVAAEIHQAVANAKSSSRCGSRSRPRRVTSSRRWTR